jgi:hypothetical protein
MSEFILLGQPPVAIDGISATQSYLYTLNKNGAFSSDSDAQYGNGFASFKIDGSCDTVWAGHRFQSRVSSNTADGSRNEIRIEDSGSVSGGQGILIWSLNYDLTNRGVISGATSDKFGIAETANVAVLFKGDTGTGYGTPVTTGANRVVNSGTISSPGTAIKAEAGDTLITNQPEGIISGGNYAVQTGSGNDTVTVQAPDRRGHRSGCGDGQSHRDGRGRCPVDLHPEPGHRRLGPNRQRGDGEHGGLHDTGRPGRRGQADPKQRELSDRGCRRTHR